MQDAFVNGPGENFIVSDNIHTKRFLAWGVQ